MIEASGKDVEIHKIGLRPGEKLYEELMSEEEGVRALETEELFIIMPYHLEAGTMITYYPGAVKAGLLGYRSDEVDIIGTEEIKQML
jgi:FlaA1/EpsC-like NDP-sugar epimerase